MLSGRYSPEKADDGSSQKSDALREVFQERLKKTVTRDMRKRARARKKKKKVE